MPGTSPPPTFSTSRSCKRHWKRTAGPSLFFAAVVPRRLSSAFRRRRGPARSLAKEEIVQSRADTLEDLDIVQVDSLMDVGLAHDIIGGVVEVLGGEGGLIYRGEARVRLADDMLLGELHASPLALLLATRAAR